MHTAPPPRRRQPGKGEWTADQTGLQAGMGPGHRGPVGRGAVSLTLHLSQGNVETRPHSPGSDRAKGLTFGHLLRLWYTCARKAPGPEGDVNSAEGVQ